VAISLSKHQLDPDALITRAEQALGASLTLVESLNPPDRRTRVLRCRTSDETVIVKAGSDSREHDALALLDGTGVAPRLLAADDSRLIVIMEDLPGKSLHAILQSEDAAAAEAGLLAFARVFRAMHRRTAREGPLTRVDAERIGALWDFAPTEEVAVHVNALTQNDVGPDGCMVIGNDARLFDFEIAEGGAAMTDVVLWHMGFPNCGASAGAIPAEVLERMEHAYGTIDADKFGHAYAYRLLERLDRYHEWNVREEDWVWGPASGRQRLLWMLQRCPTSTPLARAFADLYERLRTEWRDTPDSLPIFPAFRSSRHPPRA